MSLSFLLGLVVFTHLSNALTQKNENLNGDIQVNSIESRIFGGSIANRAAFPYMTPLYTKYISSQGLEFETFCGASLISDRFVLTAAHCVSGGAEGAKVQLGAFDRRLKSEPGRLEIEIPKENIIPYEGYDWELKQHDIALIKLPEKINFTRFVQPVKLPRRSFTDLEGKMSIVTGWGAMGQNADSSDVLRYAQLNVKFDGFCEGFYKKFYHPSNICIDAAVRSPCSGDSGGAAVVTDEIEQSYVIVGVAAYVSGWGCQKGYPVVYTRVTSYLDWIHKHTGIQIRD